MLISTSLCHKQRQYMIKWVINNQALSLWGPGDCNCSHSVCHFGFLLSAPRERCMEKSSGANRWPWPFFFLEWGEMCIHICKILGTSLKSFAVNANISNFVLIWACVSETLNTRKLYSIKMLCKQCQLFLKWPHCVIL